MRVFVMFVLIMVLPGLSKAWIYPEHRAIAILAIQRLTPEERMALEQLWSVARRGHEMRLSASIIEPEQGRHPKYLDFAAWPAIAGDHSCSPNNMLRSVLQSDWILDVADVAARLQADIQKSRSKSQRINSLRKSDTRLQRADQEYASRAGSNNVHFLLARQDAEVDALHFLMGSLMSGTELNALGAYSWFHLSAIRKLIYYRSGDLNEEERSAVIISALADEAFALHFLEDVFAAGHIAGTWGATSVRKGTHDYYNEKGLEVSTWDGRRMIVRGDAFMNSKDALIAATAVHSSLEQLIAVAVGHSPYDAKKIGDMVMNQPDTFNVCSNRFMPSRDFENENLRKILMLTPIPGLATGEGELPRFRSELGGFFGVSSGFNVNAIDGGFGTEQTKAGGVFGLEANARAGFGLDGVLNQSGDGLMFVQAGFRQDASSTNQFNNSKNPSPAGAITAAIPGRFAYNLRFRMPYWLVPGDLIVAAPFLFLISKNTLTKMAVTAANGGLLRWQSVVATKVGSFQFVLGREIGFYIYGSSNPRQDAFIATTPSSNLLVQYSSTKLDFPIIEYRPTRTFSLNQTSSILIQVTGGVDMPNSPTVLAPAGEPAPPLKNVWYLGIRVLFDWRKYF